MSSWGSWSKISKLKQVSDFSDFWSKISFFNTSTGSNFENHTCTHQLYFKSLQCPLVVQGRSRQRGPKGLVYGWMDGMGWDGSMGWDGI